MCFRIVLLVAFWKRAILDAIKSETDKRTVDNASTPLVLDDEETDKMNTP